MMGLKRGARPWASPAPVLQRTVRAVPVPASQQTAVFHSRVGVFLPGTWTQLLSAGVFGPKKTWQKSVPWQLPPPKKNNLVPPHTLQAQSGKRGHVFLCAAPWPNTFYERSALDIIFTLRLCFFGREKRKANRIRTAFVLNMKTSRSGGSWPITDTETTQISVGPGTEQNPGLLSVIKIRAAVWPRP
jgi:hypothetical protein